MDPGTLDLVAARIQTCSNTGLVPEGILVRSLELLRETPCSTCLVEKAHGAGSIVRNFHHRLSPIMLAHRALLAQVEPFFSEKKADEYDKLRSRIEVLRRPPKQFLGRQEYCRRLVAAAVAGSDGNGVELARVRQTCIASHAGRYCLHGPAEKAELSAAAAEVMQDREKDQMML